MRTAALARWIVSRKTLRKFGLLGGAILLLKELGLIDLLSLAHRPSKPTVSTKLTLDPEYPNAEARDEVSQKAQALLLKNMRTGVALFGRQKTDYTYICPSAKKYSHQWLEDSSFHSIVTSRYDPELAKKEVASLFKAMQPTGFMPNMIFWDGFHHLGERLVTALFVDGLTSHITQPPVIALSLEEIYRNTQDTQFVHRYLDLVKRFFRWLELRRDPDRDKLISIIHPWESGIDACPVFDSLLGIGRDDPSALEVYKGLYGLLLKYRFWNWNENRIFASDAFNVEHVMYNCIYAQGLRAISRLAAALGDSQTAQDYQIKADQVESAILTICWDEEQGIFFDVVCPEHRKLKVRTVSSLFPLILDTIPSGQVSSLVNNYLVNENEFWLAYPIPSVSKSERSFNPRDNPILWRGPTWINTNWFLVKGLIKQGYPHIAREVARRTISLVDQAGFWEFYNPDTGEPGGQPRYSWSTLAVDLFNYL